MLLVILKIFHIYWEYFNEPSYAMQISFADEYWQLLYEGRAPGKPKFSASVIRQYQKAIRVLSQVTKTSETMTKFRVVNQERQELHPPQPIHPGEMLADELEARNTSQKKFAEQLGMRPSHLNELLKGKRNFTAQIALKVESALGIDASFWMRAQGEYFLDVARLERSEMEALQTV